MSDGSRFPVPDIVRRRAVSEGETGLAWLAALDDTLSAIEQNWHVTIGPAYEGGSAAYVAEAVAADGAVCIVKVSTPESDAGRNEADVLRSAAGTGYARLVRHDAARHAMLLEKLGDRLDTLDLPYQQQIDIMCATLLRAWMPVPAGGAYTNGADKANNLAEAMIRMWMRPSSPAPRRSSIPLSCIAGTAPQPIVPRTQSLLMAIRTRPIF